MYVVSYSPSWLWAYCVEAWTWDLVASMSAGITDICHYAQLYIFTSLYFVLPASIVRVFHLSSFNYFSLLKIEPRAHKLISAVSQPSLFFFLYILYSFFKKITYRVMDFILSSHIFTLYLERGLHFRVSFMMPLNSCSRPSSPSNYWLSWPILQD